MAQRDTFLRSPLLVSPMQRLPIILKLPAPLRFAPSLELDAQQAKRRTGHRSTRRPRCQDDHGRVRGLARAAKTHHAISHRPCQRYRRKNNRAAEERNTHGPWQYHAVYNESGCRTVTAKKNAGGHKQNNAAHRKSRCGKTLEGENQGARGREYHRDRSGHHQEWCWWALESSAG